MPAKVKIAAAPSAERLLATSTTAIVRSGIFGPVRYAQAAGLPENSNVQTVVVDYLTRGESKGLCLHCLFVPQFVRRQLDELGIPLVGGSVLVTYLAHPEAPLDPHPVFDHRRFAREDSSKTHLENYVQSMRRGVLPASPHVLFDRAFYRERYPRVATDKIDAFMHYIMDGWKRGQLPHPLFDSNLWWSSVSALGIARTTQDPLTLYCSDRSTWHARTHLLFEPQHFLENLTIAGLKPSVRDPPLADMLLRESEISGHRLFDPAFYRAQARLQGVDIAEHPLLHYARARRDGLDPHPLFCEAFYLNRYRDVAESGLNAFEHFVRIGQSEGRDPNPLFSAKYYAANPAVPRGETKTLEHYIVNGSALVDPHPLFDAATYAARHTECLRTGDTPLGHYARTWAEHGLRFPPWGTALFPRRNAPRDYAPPDVILISHELTRTGAPMILLRIVQELVVRRGLRTLVLAMAGGELLEEFCEWSAVVDMSLIRAADVTDAGFVASLQACFSERWRPRMVIANTACINQEAFTFHGTIPWITLIHELASSFSEERFRSIYANSDLVIYPAEFVRNEAHVLYPLSVEKTAVLPQGLLDPEFGLGDAQQARASVLEEIAAEPDAFIVLGCGTMDLRKGIDTFVHVARATLRASKVSSNGRPVHFIWIGGGPTHAHSVVWYARQDIDRSGLAERVHLLGARLSTESYFLACDAFIMTSRMDPFPCVIHEAMACAKPIVGFADNGGSPEALRDEVGIVVEYGDVAAMAEEILRLRDDPDRAAKCGSRAREMVRTRYQFSDYVDRMLALARDRLSVGFAEPITDSAIRRDRGRVVVTCGDSEPPLNWQQSELLVGGLLDRGYDAELLFTGNPRSLITDNRAGNVPLRVLAPSFGKSVTAKQRWDTLTRILAITAPIVLVHNLDPIASALAPVPSRGMGILGIVSSASQEQLEQIARLGRYWQRAVTTSESLLQLVLEAAPFLRERLVVIPRPVHHYPEPELRKPDRPLGIVVSGRHPRRDSAMAFLVPLVRGLQTARIPFALTAVNAGPEAGLLKMVAHADAPEGRVRIVDSPNSAEVSELLRANDVLVMLSEGDGRGINLDEAMCAGLAVIAIAKDADSDKRFHDGIHGFSAPMAGVQTCLERLGLLASNRELLERMRSAAHQTGSSSPDAAQIGDRYAALIEEMLAELRARAYVKPAPLYIDPIIGALSLPPFFHLENARLGFPTKP